MSQDDFDLYLASSSPRRQELLQQIGVRYRIVSNEAEEIPRPGEQPADYALRVSQDKARAGWANLSAGAQKPVLGADTVVSIDGEIMGKPENEAHALAMLERLSGQTHEVFTAIALAEGDEIKTAISHTAVSHSKVSFRELSREECLAYWQTGEPADKAGAYAIQGKAAIFIRHLSGSYSGVMGLPLYETAELLRDAGICFIVDE